MTIRIKGFDLDEAQAQEHKATAIEMWYDHHRREWVIYPIDEEGNQLDSAKYGFNKKEAQVIKNNLKAEWLNK